MPLGNDEKRSSVYIKVLKHLFKSHEIALAYELIDGIGGLQTITKEEESVYRGSRKTSSFSNKARKNPETDGETRIRYQLGEQRNLKIGSWEFEIFYTEASTKKTRDRKNPGGSADLLAIDKRTGRIVVLELKDKSNSEYLLSALLQGTVYRAQFPHLKKHIIEKLKETNSHTRLKSKMRYGTIVLAVDGWKRLKEEEIKMKALLSKRNSSELYAVATLKKQENLWIGEWFAGAPRNSTT